MRRAVIIKSLEKVLSADNLIIYAIIIALIFHNLIYLLTFQNSFPYDDAYIAYRYAENIASGAGWVYNSGETTSGTTSYLNVAINAALSFLLNSDAALTGRLISIGFTSVLLILSVFVFSWYFESKGFTLVYILLFILSPTIYNIGLSGMESGFFLTTIFAILILSFKKHYYYAAILTGILIFIRPDALIFTAVYIFYIFMIKGINLKKKSIIISIITVITGGYFLINLMVFNNIIPQSLYSKSIVFKDFDLSQDRLDLIYGFFRSRLIYFLFPAVLFGLYATWKINNIYSFLLSFFPILWILTYFIYNPWMREWYYFIPYPFLLFISLYGIKKSELFSALLGMSKEYMVKGMQTIAILIFAVVLSISFFHQYEIHFGCTSESTFNSKVRETADFLSAQDSIKGKTIFLGDIGYIGYKTKAKIIDYMGLVYPESLKYLKEKTEYSNGRNLSWSKLIEFIQAENPDFLVFDTWYVFYQKLKEDTFIKMKYTKLNIAHAFDIWINNDCISNTQ